MGYCQNGLEIEKKSMLPYSNAGLIRVKRLVEGTWDIIYYHLSRLKSDLRLYANWVFLNNRSQTIYLF